MTEGWGDAHGIWRCRGYGRVLSVDADVIRSFDTTSESCIEIGRWTRQDPIDAFDRVEVDGDVLRLYEPGGITRYDHDRIDAVPTTDPTRDPADPAWNFDVFWRAFDEHYAFFDERGVDWARVRADLGPRADAASRARLADVLGEAVGTLADGHVELDLGDRAIGSDDDDGRSLSRWWRAEAGASTGGFSAAMRDLTLEGLGVRGARALANERLIVGEIDEATGYLAVLSMWGFASEDATQSQDVAAAGDATDAALAELAGKRALIVDVRTNGGGWDAVSLAIASRIADRSRVAFTKRARDGAGYTERQPISVEPGGAARFLGPVALLVSGSTGSAAEIFTFAMGALPNVTIVGTPTRGITSDELPKHLPNGWVVTLSNERYETPEGVCAERVGIPPDVLAAPEDGESLAAYLRRGIEVATRVGSST